ncbi:MAG: hypothetical protein M0Q38_11675 [Bacteroidales bacterium]|jgi:hypothetical protein|nr:hypothetical protein [Bacteroidales bacterium]
MIGLSSIIPILLLAGTTKDDSTFDSSIISLILALVSLFGLVLFIVFIKKQLIPVFRVWYITLVYGRYSLKYLEFFKENNLRSPHNNCIKDEITLHFMVFFRKIRNAQDFKTSINIDFGEIPFMSSDKLLRKLKGRPYCINVARFPNAKVKVVGYRDTQDGTTMKSLYYFLNDHFVLGEYNISESLHLNPDPLLKKLSSKYLNGIALKGDVFYIIDPGGNQINFENNGFSIGIRYLYNADEHSNELLSEMFSDKTVGGSNYRKTLRHEGYSDQF